MYNGENISLGITLQNSSFLDKKILKFKTLDLPGFIESTWEESKHLRMFTQTDYISGKAKLATWWIKIHTIRNTEDVFLFGSLKNLSVCRKNNLICDKKGEASNNFKSE